MSQKVHPRSLRNANWYGSNALSFTQSKPFLWLKKSLQLSNSYACLFSKIRLFRSTKAPSKTKKKKSNFLVCSLSLRQSKHKVYLTPLLMPFPKKGYLRKYMPIKAVFKKSKAKKYFSKKNLSYKNLAKNKKAYLYVYYK